jgi:signal recognition particle subunit SRP54
MGSIKSIVSMLPGVGNKLKDADIDEKQFTRIEAMITSMTKAERAKPSLINPSRKRRIAKGSGTKVEDVNRLLKQFEQMKQMMKKLGIKGRGTKKGRRGMGMDRRARKMLSGMDMSALKDLGNITDLSKLK